MQSILDNWLVILLLGGNLVYHQTGSAFAVGTASAVLRLGWLLPQFVLGSWRNARRGGCHFTASSSC